jgi:uncharacterized protein YceH (UPF0502 family)
MSEQLFVIFLFVHVSVEPGFREQSFVPDLSSACTVDSAVQQWKKSHAAVNDLSRKQVAEVEALVRQVD